MNDEGKAVDEELSFSAAMEELERILKGIEDEEIDIDVLGRELKLAAELLELCRGKIRRAETEVSQIVQGLEESRSGGEEDREAVVDEAEEELPF